jgi:hypothetical protein
MCKVLKVSVSGYYYWLKHPVGLRTLKQNILLAEIRKVFDNSKKRGPDAHARGRSMEALELLVN